MIARWREAATDWFMERDMRERVLIAAGSLVLAAALVFTYGYDPVRARHAEALEQLAKAESDYLWLRRQTRALGKLRAGGAVMPVRMPAEALKRRLIEHLKANSLQAEIEPYARAGIEYLRVRSEDIDGRLALRWIERLLDEGFSVTRFRLDSKGGKVTAVTLVRIGKGK